MPFPVVSTLGLCWQEKEPPGFGINNQLQIIAQAEVSQFTSSRVSSEQEG